MWMVWQAVRPLVGMLLLWGLSELDPHCLHMHICPKIRIIIEVIVLFIKTKIYILSDHLWNQSMNPVTNKLLKIKSLKKVAAIILQIHKSNFPIQNYVQMLLMKWQDQADPLREVWSGTAVCIGMCPKT